MLELANITKRFGAQIGVDSVSLTFKRGDVVGVVGENGAGKSTLLNIVSGIVKPDSGTMLLDGEELGVAGYKHANVRGIWRVFQDPALIPGIPLYENVFLGHEERFVRFGVLNRREMIRQARRVLGEMNLEPDVRQLTSTFSYSLRQAVEAVKAVAVPHALGLGAAFVLLDEPSAGLTHVEVPRLLELIRLLATRGLGVVFVSHRLSEILAVCDEIYVLKDGAVVAQTRAAATDESQLHELMVGRVRPADFHAEALQASGLTEQVVLSVHGFSRRDRRPSHGREQHRFVFEDVSLDLREGEILGVAGLVGSGKSALARCLAGIDHVNSGTLQFMGETIRRASLQTMKSRGIVYLSDDRRTEGLIGTFPVKWNISLPSGERGAAGFATRGGLWRSRFEAQETQRVIEKHSIKGEPGGETGRLSGGNQQKVALAKWTRRQPRVLIVENPTIAIDVGSKGQIYRLLRDLAASGKSIVLVGDDLTEVIGLSDRIAVMRNGRIVDLLDSSPGNKPEEARIVALMT